MRNTSVIGWLLAAPLSLVLLVFLVAPIAMIVVVSNTGGRLRPATTNSDSVWVFCEA